MAVPVVYTDFSLSEHKQELCPKHLKTSFSNILDHDFSILHVNMRSFHNKVPQFEFLLAELDLNFSCIVVSETWFSENEYLNKFFIKGYNLFCSSRPQGGGGGVCIYVADKYEAAVEDMRLAGAEAVLVRISCSGRPVCSVLPVYRAPSGSPAAFLADWEARLPSLPTNSVVVGDLNFDLNSKNSLDNNSLNYLRIMSSNGFFNIIDSPTRYGDTKISLLDHIFVNNLSNSMLSCTIDTDLIADHLPIAGFVKFRNPASHNVNANLKAKITKLDRILLTEKIADPECWSSVLGCNEANSAFQLFTETFQQKLTEASMTKTRKASKKHTFKQPWMSHAITKKIEQREKFRKLCNTYPFDKKIERKYKHFRNSVKNDISKAKKAYYQAEFEQCKTNSNEKWKFLNKVLNKNKTIDPIPSFLDNNNEKTSSVPEMADIFNSFFTKIGEGLAEKLPPSTTNFDFCLEHDEQIPEFKFSEISSETILEIINKANGKKAAGNDKISMCIIKENKNILAPILTHLINVMIRNCTFPSNQKVARVKPLHKKGSKADPNNYRPISILTSVSKICEKVLAMQLRQHFEANKLFYENQYGFREKKNTSLAISKLMENLYESFNNSEIKQGVFIDFSEAFDTINHDILIKKLSYYNFTSNAVKLMQSYLTGRSQFVKLGDHSSSLRDIKIGVPQGSVLGPILFLIFINDLIKSAPQLEYILFADDTNIFCSKPEILKDNLKKVEEWCLANRLILNSTKTYQVIFKAPNKVIENPDIYNLSLNASQISTIPSTKFLGVHIDNNITFKIHIAQICKTLNYILLIMRSVRQYLDVTTMKNLYYTFFYPHIIYGIEFWGHAAQSELNQILLLQKTALRIILNIKPRGHVSSYFKTLKIMPIDMLFKFRFLILFSQQVSENCLNIKISKNERTRSNNRFQPKKANNCRGERSLLIKGVSLFNSYLLGEEGAEPSALRGRLADALWEGGV